MQTMGKEIGIDLGTTNTVVSYLNKKGKLRQLKYSNGEEIIPSVLYFYSKNEYEIGKKAKKLMETNKNNAGVANFKSTLGDFSFKHEITAENGETFSLRSRDAAKYFLNKVVRGIEEKLIKEFGPLEGCIDRAVITVPAKFTSTEKGATKKAARDSGLPMVKLAAEPTAAAIAYQSDWGEEQQNETILVYDFGGGTFDVSVIQSCNGSFQEIATNGDENLGGNNLTAKLAEEILNRVNDDFGMELPIDETEFDEDYYGMKKADYKKNITAIFQAANLLKERLSTDETVSEDVNVLLPDGKNEFYNVEFSRDELEDFICEDIASTVDITIRTIEEAAQKGVDRIDQIVLAGGSSQIPLVKRSLEEKLAENHLDDSNVLYCEDVSTLISRGATVMAQKIKDIGKITQQITNVQLGVAATEGMQYGKFQKIISEDAPLPCTMKREFRLAQDGQQRLEIAYYEYDIKNYPNATRVDEDGINEIDTLIIDQLPPDLKKDDTSILVEFTAQLDGSLDIHAEIKDTQGKAISQKELRVVKESDLE